MIIIIRRKIADEIKAQKVLNTNLLNTILSTVSLADFSTFSTNVNKKLAGNKQELTKS